MCARGSTCRCLARPLTTALLALALGACVTVQVPKLPADELPAHWRNAPQLGKKPDLTGWWKHFHDPTLDRLVTRALRTNPDVTQAIWKLRAARAMEEASGAKFKPRVAFRTLEQSNAANTASFFQIGFDASWEIGLFGRRSAGAHIAAADTGAAAAELQSARVSLVAEVVREYLRLRTAQHREALLARAAQADEKKLRLLRVRQHLQLAAGREVDMAETTLATAKAALADPRVEVARSAEALAVLEGQSEPDPAWLKPAPPPHLAGGNVASVPANLLRTRPEIRYAETRVVKAAGELGIAKANLYPSLSLGGGLTFASRILGHDRLGPANEIVGIGPFINIPLFHWGRLQGVRKARGAQLQAALAGYRKSVLAGAAQVETDLASLRAARDRLHQQGLAAANAAHGLAVTRQLAALGQADTLDIADARLALTTADLARGDARLTHGLAFVALYKALGGAPLPPANRAVAGRHKAADREDARP